MDDNYLITSIPEVKVTTERPVPLDLEESLGNAGLPRATIAASREKPHGSDRRQPIHRDRVIRPFDTLKGLRKLGFNFILALFFTFAIHSGFAYPSQESWIPILCNPFFKIYTDRIHKCKHGNDTETLDTEGRFVPEKFEEILTKFDREGKGGLSFSDIVRMINVNYNIFDFFGYYSSWIEWIGVYLLCAENGVVDKEKIRGIYDVLY
ncbi:7007_t:CDS:2 [Diversispora eburnea]|uniref:7007_t:CDS:1 n=1 Tax=Diversispora eburnea TaxID=1213867 RepID=A0A9N8V3Y1_9GLOM|nr:7007_t:CDS:2 [Diversispora eburnea]